MFYIFYTDIAGRKYVEELSRVDIELYQHGS